MKDSITSEELLAQIANAAAALPKSPINPLFNTPFCGMPIIEHQPTFEPKLQIDPEFKHCSDKFRNRMNAWLLQRFGARDTSVMKLNEVFIVNNQTFIARPETASILRTIG